MVCGKTGKNGKIPQFPLEVVQQALDRKIVPVMYGDILLDAKKGSTIASTESLIAAACHAFVAQGRKVHKVIHNGVTPGVLDRLGRVIPHISAQNLNKVKKLIYGTDGFDVTGGMLHKIEESMALVEKGVHTVIINGVSEKDLLKRALLDEKVTGTYFR